MQPWSYLLFSSLCGRGAALGKLRKNVTLLWVVKINCKSTCNFILFQIQIVFRIVLNTLANYNLNCTNIKLKITQCFSRLYYNRIKHLIDDIKSYGFHADTALADINVVPLTQICEQKLQEPLNSQIWKIVPCVFKTLSRIQKVHIWLMPDIWGYNMGYCCNMGQNKLNMDFRL